MTKDEIEKFQKLSLLEKTKELCKIEIKEKYESKCRDTVSVLPILHNKDFITLLFYGWAIHLYDDGHYFLEEDTSGG